MLESLFTHPWLLGALIAASLPWVIEWLFRRRKRQVELPTLRFILKDKEQEQVKKQDRILLLLRTCAIILLVLAVARPALRAGMFGVGNQRRVLVILDSTASMHQRVGVTTAFGIAQKKAAAMVRALPKDTLVTVAVLGEQMRMVVDAESDVHTVAGRIEQLRPGSSAGPISEVFTWVKDYLDKSKWENTELYILSDFQKYTWQPPGGKMEAISGEMRALSDHCEMFMVDVGGTPTYNYMVTSLSPAERLITASRPVVFRAKIESTGKVPQDHAARVMFIVDGEKKAVRELPPGSTGESITFEHRFTGPGEFLVEIQVEGDEHPIDNRRLYLCQVPEEIKVLLVDENAGNTSADTYFLARAIDPVRRPGMDRISPFSVKSVTPAQLAYENLEPYRAIAVAGLDAVAETFAARLERYVAEGGSVWFFLGPKTSSYDYNRLLYKDGRGLLPAKLGDAPTLPKPVPHLIFASASHPAIAELQGSAGKESAMVAGYMPLTDADKNGGQIIATFSNGAVAMAHKGFERGQVVLSSSTAGPEWNVLPALPEFPVLAQEMLKCLAGDLDTSVNLNAGDRFQSPVYVSAQHLLLKRPDGTKERLTPKKKEGAEEAWSISYDHTDQDGMYSFADVPKEVLARRRFVVNPPTEEGDLTRLQESDFRDLFGSSTWRWLNPEQSVEDFVSKLHSVTELAPVVLAILAAIMAFESFLAVTFGRRRAEDKA